MVSVKMIAGGADAVSVLQRGNTAMMIDEMGMMGMMGQRREGKER